MLFFFTCCFVCSFLCIVCTPLKVTASEYTNAYTFYQQNGTVMKFVPSTDTNGNIYYATKGKKGYNVSTLYSTIGWKISVKQQNGTILQEIYFQLGGNYMKTIDTQQVNGYEYTLYSVSLSAIKGRMNQNSQKALEQGTCTLAFDACIAVKKRGVLQGTMNDNGITSGTVHMTYEGIAKAAPWASATKTALAGYYNRSVIGLFSTLTLTKDEGIALVEGAGTYCYGTVISIDAIPLEGYTFVQWSGNENYYQANPKILMGNTDISLKATSRLSSLTVTYFQNTSESDTKIETQTFLYGGNLQRFQDFGWKKTGHYQSGWAKKRQATEAEYAVTNSVSNEWILEHLPHVSLYAVWNPNQYKILFDANGGSGTMLEIESDYASKITLPENAFFYSNGVFLGWSTNPLETNPEYTANQMVEVKQLAEAVKMVHSNHAEIRLYAIWDNVPAIAAADIYVALKDARENNITEAFLASYVKAIDIEDGEIPYGKHEKNAFWIENYERTKFTELEKEAEIKLTFCVTDSSANVCKREITVFVVDTDLYKEKEVIGKVRFISEKYYKNENGAFVTEENGGLKVDSIWKTSAYQAILDKIFQK